MKRNLSILVFLSITTLLAGCGDEQLGGGSSLTAVEPSTSAPAAPEPTVFTELLEADFPQDGEKTDFGINVWGDVYRQLGDLSLVNADHFKVKFCSDRLPQGKYGGGICFTCMTSAGQHYETYQPAAEHGDYWMFVYKDSYYWGSSTQSCYSQKLFLGSYNIINAVSRPRPLPPEAITPTDGQTNVIRKPYFEWTDGMDEERESEAWPVTYDFYLRYHGGTEQLIAEDLETCSFQTTQLLMWNKKYYWRVEAKMAVDVGAPGDPYYRTSSEIFEFTTTSFGPHLQIH